MSTRLVRIVTCDKCHTEVMQEMGEDFELPKGWEALLLHPEDDVDNNHLHMCTSCMRDWRIFMGFTTFQNEEVKEIKQVPEEFGFGSMG